MLYLHSSAITSPCYVVTRGCRIPLLRQKNRELILYLCVTPAARINTSAPCDKRGTLNARLRIKGERGGTRILWFANFHGIVVPWRYSRLSSMPNTELSRLSMTASFRTVETNISDATNKLPIHRNPLQTLYLLTNNNC